MSKVIRLYPKVPVKGQDFTGAKVVTIPSQSLTLKQILQRFVRGEKLPIEKDGFYSEKHGDVEKLVRMDILDQYERSKSMWSALNKAAKTIKAREDMAKSAGGGSAGAASAQPSSPEATPGGPKAPPGAPPQVGTP